MKRVLLFLLFAFPGILSAQYNESFFSGSEIKIGAGYAHDFPGLNGLGMNAEFVMPLMDKWEGGFGIKRFSLEGHPRNAGTLEYTRATTIDFNIYFLPIQTESHTIRIGAGYAFSNYSIRRSFPLISGTGPDKATTWPIQDQRSRTSGMSIMAEYEYYLPVSGLSIGLRAGYYKAYDRVTYIGPFAGFKF